LLTIFWRSCPANLEWVEASGAAMVSPASTTSAAGLDWGSALRRWKVNNLEIDGFVGRQSAGSKMPAIQLRDVKRALVHNCGAPEGTGVFLELEVQTQEVIIMGNDLRLAGEAYSLGTDADLNAVFQ